MFEESGFFDEVIITASDEVYADICGKEAVVLHGSRDKDGLWLAVYVPGDKVWKVKACDIVPTGRRVLAPALP